MTAPSTKILLNSGPSDRGWHRLETFIRCGQLYAFKYLLHLETGAAAPLVRGSIGHVGLAHYYARVRATQAGTDPNAYYTPLEAMQLVAQTFGDAGTEQLPVASRGVLAYIRQDALPPKILQVENALSATISWPERVAALKPSRALETHRYTARLDLIVEDARGVWIWDHKIVGRISAPVSTRYTCSGQFLGAQWFGHALFGERFAGACINVLAVEARVPNFQRITLEPAPFLLASLPQIVCDAEESIARLADEGRDPWDYPKAANEFMCTHIYGVCPFRDLCRFGKGIL